MKNLQLILIVLLLGLNCFTLYKLNQSSNAGNGNGSPTTSDSVGCPAQCIDDRRYDYSPNYEGGGLPLNLNRAFLYSKAFKDKLKVMHDCWVNADCDKTHPGEFLNFPNAAWISKRAIDSMFKYNTTANGIFCNFVYDPDKDSVNLVFHAIRKEYNLIKKANAAAKEYMFISQSLCPDECGDLTKKNYDEEMETQKNSNPK